MFKRVIALVVALAVAGLAFLSGATTANAAPKHLSAPSAQSGVKWTTINLATPVNDGTFGQTKYVSFDSTHRFGTYAQMTFDTVGGQRVARGEYISAWTEYKNSAGDWVRSRMCVGQELLFRYSLRKSDGNHPSPMDYFNQDSNVAYGNYNPGNTTLWPLNQYTVSLHAGYIGEGSCLYPYNVDKGTSFYAHQY